MTHPLVPLLRLAAVAIVLALVAGGCASGPSSSQCKEVCRRQAKCVEQVSETRAASAGSAPGRARGDSDADDRGRGGDEDDRNKFDTNECVAACTALERDQQGKKLVKKHMDCARAAKDCSALLACQ